MTEQIKVHDIPTAKRLQMIHNLMRRHRSFKKLASDISSVLQNKPSDLKEFHKKINGHLWQGYLYTPHNSLYGSIFSYFGRQPFIVRGFPKIHYAESTKVFQQKETYIEEKVDGTNIVCWVFPDGTFWGKTRETISIFDTGYKGIRWYDLIEKTGYLNQLKEACLKSANPSTYMGNPFNLPYQQLPYTHQIAFELYGKENPGEFIKYTIPISIKVLEIYHSGTFSYRSPETKRSICQAFGLPVVEQKEICDLSKKEIERLEYEAKALNHEDGMEGFVAKYYDYDGDYDVHMGKIKCEEIRQACWGNKIPTHVIRKSVRACQEANVPLLVNDEVNPDALTFVMNDMKEDINATIVEMNKMKIEYVLKNPLEEPKKVDLSTYEDQELFKIFDEIKAQGIEMTEANKGKILSMASKSATGIAGARLFLTFKSYLIKQTPEDL